MATSQPVIVTQQVSSDGGQAATMAASRLMTSSAIPLMPSSVGDVATYYGTNGQLAVNLAHSITGAVNPFQTLGGQSVSTQTVKSTFGKDLVQ